MNLPEAFLNRMRSALKDEFDEFLSTYEKTAYKGLRVNLLKIDKAEFEKISPFSLRPVPWAEDGYYVEEEKAGRHPYHFAGLYYMQEPSAMSVAPLLGVAAGDRVLDLCAAPGGKTTGIASRLQGTGILVANEINPGRAKILSQNVERMGVKNALVVNASPEQLAEKFPCYFDKILVDAPCSGEGMFKKNEKEAIENWSEENVALCAERQKGILECAGSMLAGGGTLVYSTCTFAPQEDEEQIAGFIGRHPEFTLEKENKLYPHKIEGEGHYYAVLRKTEGDRADLPVERSNLSQKDKKTFEAFLSSVLTVRLVGTPYRSGDTVYLLPEGTVEVKKLPLLRAGIRMGEFEKDRFTPGHALAVALKPSEVKRYVDLNETQAEKYLRGETVDADVEKGWCLVTVNGYSLGWGKATNGVVKNHFPKGLRLVK